MVTKYKHILNEFLNFAEVNPLNTAIIDDNSEISYAEFINRINLYIQVLRKNKIQVGDFVLIPSVNVSDAYAAIYATWFCNAVFVPLNTAWPKQRCNEIKENCLAKYYIQLDSTPVFIDLTSSITLIEVDNSVGYKQDLMVPMNENSVCSILYTSGSTGTPKGVPYTFENLNCTMDSFNALDFHLSASDRVLQMFDLTFDMSMLSYLAAFTNGASIVLPSKSKIKHFAAIEAIQKHLVTFVAMVPSTLWLLKRYFNQIKLPSVKVMMLGGEPFHESLAMEWFSCIPNSRLFNISGPTEICMACMGLEVLRSCINPAHNNILAFGYPWKNTKAIVVDSNNQQVKKGETGFLSFAGDHVMKGYFNLKNTSDNSIFNIEYQGLIHRFYNSGDRVLVNDKGVYFTLGRTDQQVKVRGYKIELAEIEVQALKIVNSCRVIALPYMSENSLQEIALFIETSNLNKDELRQKLSQILPEYMLPSVVIRIEEFPTLPNNKIDRIKLLDYVK